MGSNKWKRFHSPLTSVTSLVPMSLSFLPLASRVPEEQFKASPGHPPAGQGGQAESRRLGCRSRPAGWAAPAPALGSQSVGTRSPQGHTQGEGSSPRGQLAPLDA